MKKILIAIKDDLTREIYSETFIKENYSVLETKSGKEALAIIQEGKPDIVLADAALPELDGFDLLTLLRKASMSQKLPIIIFAQFEKREDRLRAIELEAKDFIVGTANTPRDVLLRVKIHLGEEETHRIHIGEKNTEEAKQIARSLGYAPNLNCPRCENELILFLIRDLSKGQNYFKLSLICPNCK